MANVYAELLRVLPSKKQLIGKVTSVNTTLKLSTVLLLGGGVMTAKGVGTVDAHYLIEDGILVQELPGLTAYNVTIY